MAARKLSRFNVTSLTLGFAFLYLPIVILVIYSFNASRLVTVWGGWSLRWYREFFNDTAMIEAAWMSFRVGATSASIATVLGTLAAVRAGGLADRVVMAFAVLGFSSPVFVIAFLLVYVFALTLGWFPTQGYVPLSQGALACLHSLILPGIALALLYASLLARVTRASLLEVLSEDYIRTANAKGLTPARITIRHALSNAAVPIVTVIGIGMAALLGGVVVTETVFNIPGLGRLATDAIQRRDYPVVQGLILVFSAVYVVINLLVDLSYVLFDPRVRY